MVRPRYGMTRVLYEGQEFGILLLALAISAAVLAVCIVLIGRNAASAPRNPVDRSPHPDYCSRHARPGAGPR